MSREYWLAIRNGRTLYLNGWACSEPSDVAKSLAFLKRLMPDHPSNNAAVMVTIEDVPDMEQGNDDE